MVQNHPMTSYRSSAEGKVTSSKGVRRITEPSSSPGDTRGVSSYPSDCCHTLVGGKKEKKKKLSGKEHNEYDYNLPYKSSSVFKLLISSG